MNLMDHFESNVAKYTAGAENNDVETMESTDTEIRKFLKDNQTFISMNSVNIVQHSIKLWNLSTKRKTMHSPEVIIVNIRKLSLHFSIVADEFHNMLNMRIIYMAFKICQNCFFEIDGKTTTELIPVMNDRLEKIKVAAVEPNDRYSMLECYIRILEFKIKNIEKIVLTHAEFIITFVAEMLEIVTITNPIIELIESVVATSFYLLAKNNGSFTNNLLCVDIVIRFITSSSKIQQHINKSTYAMLLRSKARIIHENTGISNAEILNLINEANKVDKNISGLYFHIRLLTDGPEFDKSTYAIVFKDLLNHSDCAWKFIESLLNEFLHFARTKRDQLPDIEFIRTSIMSPIDQKYPDETNKLYMFYTILLVELEKYNDARNTLKNQQLTLDKISQTVTTDDMEPIVNHLIYTMIGCGNKLLEEQKFDESVIVFDIILYFIGSSNKCSNVKHSVTVAMLECCLKIRNFEQATKLIENAANNVSNLSDIVQLDILTLKILVAQAEYGEAFKYQQKIIQALASKPQINEKFIFQFIDACIKGRMLVPVTVLLLLDSLNAFISLENLNEAVVNIINCFYHTFDVTKKDEIPDFLVALSKILDLLQRKPQFMDITNFIINISKLLMNFTIKLQTIDSNSTFKLLLVINKFLSGNFDNVSKELQVERFRVYYLLSVVSYYNLQMASSNNNEQLGQIMDYCRNAMELWSEVKDQIISRKEFEGISNDIFFKVQVIEVKCSIQLHENSGTTDETVKQRLKQITDNFCSHINLIDKLSLLKLVEVVIGSIYRLPVFHEEIDKLWNLAFTIADAINDNGETSTNCRSRMTRLYFDFLLHCDIERAKNEITPLCESIDYDTKLYLCSQLWNRGVVYFRSGDKHNAKLCCLKAKYCFETLCEMGNILNAEGVTKYLNQTN